MNVWKAGSGATVEQEFANSPTKGNHAAYLLNTTHTPHVSDHYVTMVPRIPIILQPGRYLASVNAARTSWFWRESTTRLRSDVRADSSALGRWFTYTDFGYPTGASAVDFFGY